MKKKQKQKKARKEWAAFCRAIPAHRIVVSGAKLADSPRASVGSRAGFHHSDPDPAKPAATSQSRHRNSTAQRANERNVKRKKNEPRADQCAFVVSKRNKRCNLSCAPGSAFCGIHRTRAAADPDGDSSPPCHASGVKVACPQCGNLLRKTKLASHLAKKCNAVRRAVLHKAKPYFNLDVNCAARDSSNNSESADTQSRLLGADTTSSCSLASKESVFGPNLADPDLNAVRGIVESLFAKCKSVIGDVGSAPSDAHAGLGSSPSPLLGLAHESAKGCEPGSIVNKHLQQQAAILKVLRQRNLLHAPKSYASPHKMDIPAIVDFGAARAMMSLDIAGMVPVGTPLVAVERSRATKNAADKLLRRAGEDWLRFVLCGNSFLHCTGNRVVYDSL